jgi:hypothetical protein
MLVDRVHDAGTERQRELAGEEELPALALTRIQLEQRISLTRLVFIPSNLISNDTIGTAMLLDLRDSELVYLSSGAIGKLKAHARGHGSLGLWAGTIRGMDRRSPNLGGAERRAVVELWL